MWRGDGRQEVTQLTFHEQLKKIPSAETLEVMKGINSVKTVVFPRIHLVRLYISRQISASYDVNSATRVPKCNSSKCNLISYLTSVGASLHFQHIFNKIYF